MMRNGTMQAGAALLAGLLGAAAPAGATERGPLVALDKARDVAAEASTRAAAVDREMESAVAGEAAAEKVGAAPAAASAAAPHGARTQATERYDPAKHRDPFEPPTVASESEESPRTPLERYEVGQLKLVGVVWGQRGSRAMVEDAAGLGYIVFQGTPIGSSGGYVRAIEPRRVLIEETATNFYGEEEPREVVMELPQEDESP